MHLAQQSINIVANPPADMPSVTCQGIMGFILSPVYEVHKTSLIHNGLQAVLMVMEQAVGRGSPQQHRHVRGRRARWTAAGMNMTAHVWTWIVGPQLPLLLRTTSQLPLLSCWRSQLPLLLSGHLRHRPTWMMACVVIVPAALLNLSPLATNSLAINLWSLQPNPNQNQHQNPSPGPSQLVVLGLRQSHWWTLQMQLSSHVSRSA